MSEVFREITIRWDGVDHTFVPSVAMLRRFKAAGVNSFELLNRIRDGNPDALDLTTVHTIMLREAGVKVPEDESYALFMSGDVPAILEFYNAFIASVAPGVDLGKKPEAPKRPARKSRAKKSRT